MHVKIYYLRQAAMLHATKITSRILLYGSNLGFSQIQQHFSIRHVDFTSSLHGQTFGNGDFCHYLGIHQTRLQMLSCAWGTGLRGVHSRLIGLETIGLDLMLVNGASQKRA